MLVAHGPSRNAWVLGAPHAGRRPRGPEEVPQWKLGKGLAFLKARKKKEAMSGWRAITIVPASAKLHEAFWWATASAYLRPLPPCLLGFRAGCQPLDVAFPLQVLLSRAAEWNEPLLLASLDVPAAFDEMRPTEVAVSLRERGCPATLVAAWLRERLGSTVTVHPGPVSTPPIPLRTGCRQESPATPFLWNNMLAGPLEGVVAARRGRGAEISWTPALWDVALLV